MFEKETLELYWKLKERSIKNIGEWKHSPVEMGKIERFSRHFNEESLKNFRRNSLAGGSLTFPDRPLRYNPPVSASQILEIKMPLWQKIRGIRDIIVEILKLKKYFDLKISDLNDNLVGNPYYYKFGKINITDFSIRMCFYSKYIKREFPEAKKVLEIGGGFGGICSKIRSQTYVFVELPEVLSLAYYYFKNSNLEVHTFIEEKDTFKTGNDGAIVLVPPWMLPKLKIDFDLLINTMSFQHMTKENLNYYFSCIDNLNVKNLFLVNGEIRNRPGEVNIVDYPIPQKYILKKQEKYPFSDHLIRIYKLT